jgi:hypothetical protein
VPTALELVTLGIAVAGLLIALVSLYLTLRRDRAAGRVRVRLVIKSKQGDYRGDPPFLDVNFANPERRTVTVQRAGLVLNKGDERQDWAGWRQLIRPGGFGGFGYAVSPFSDGILLEPGAPSYSVRSSLYRIRGAFFPAVPRWVWCEDSIGGVYWEPIPSAALAAIEATKRKKRVEQPQPGELFSVEVDDDEMVGPDELYQSG